MRWMILWVLSALPLMAQDNDRAGVFDYYVLSLSWSPTWCALEGDVRGAEQCDTRRSYGWTLHGLWPQFHSGWPSYCHSPHPAPSRGVTAGMVDIMGSAGLAWHQWKKHGTCSGLTASDYFAVSRMAYDQVVRPPVLRKLDTAVRLPAGVVEEAFLQSNPDLEPDMLTTTCRDGRIQEARLCLSKTLDPVPCGQDVIRDCALGNALLDPIR